MRNSKTALAMLSCGMALVLLFIYFSGLSAKEGPTAVVEQSDPSEQVVREDLAPSGPVSSKPVNERQSVVATTELPEDVVIAIAMIAPTLKGEMLDGPCTLSVRLHSRRDADSKDTPWREFEYIAGERITVPLASVPCRVDIVAKSGEGLDAMLGKLSVFARDIRVYEIDVPLSKGLSIQCRVVDAVTGEGVEGALVSHDLSTHPITTSEGGEFLLAVGFEGRSRMVQVRAQGYGPGHTRVMTTADGRWRGEGRVATPPVVVEDEQPRETETYRIESGDLLIRGSGDESESSKPQEFFAEAGSVLIIPLYREKVITGQLILQDDLPLAGISVHARGNFYTSDYSFMLDMGDALVRPDGSFVIHGLRSDIRHNLFVDAGSVVVAKVVEACDEGRINVVIDVPSKPAVKVTIASESGRLLAGVRLGLKLLPSSGAGLAMDASAHQPSSTDAWSPSTGSWEWVGHSNRYGETTLPALVHAQGVVNAEVIGADYRSGKATEPYEEVAISGRVALKVSTGSFRLSGSVDLAKAISASSVAVEVLDGDSGAIVSTNCWDNGAFAIDGLSPGVVYFARAAKGEEKGRWVAVLQGEEVALGLR